MRNVRKKVGLIGGSFDPIHKGHLMMAKTILKKDCEEVWFIPSKDTPLKDRVLTPFSIREEMIRAAIKPYRKMKICTIENELSAPSYTIQTVKALKKKYHDFDFIWYIGNDQAAQLDKWKDIEECLSLVEFRVFKRESETITCPYELKICEMDLVHISSTMIREGSYHLTLPSVRKVMAEHALYFNDFVRNSMSEKRYLHSLSVANLSKEIAACHHLNEKQAYLAGLLHDVCKQWPHEKSEIWMKHCFSSLVDEPKAVWHGYLASKDIKRSLRVNDKTISLAVYHHVKGESINPIAMIVYMADKLDPLRGYDSSQQIALAKKDLKEAFLQVKREQLEYLQKEN